MSLEYATRKITIWGIVQGVGFRPYVAKLASDMNMKGTVANVGGLVEIVVRDRVERIDEFVSRLEREKPVPSEIVHIKIEDIEPKEFSDFSILNSAEGEREVVMLPSDIAVCDSCLEDMRNGDNRRHEHPLVSCMACGPRYTIMDGIPYDRENTSMVDFNMCASCGEEYQDIEDRRHHAQTISCLDCGPQIKLLGNDVRSESENEKEVKKNREALIEACKLIKEGKIIAFKSMGGYNLIADPFNQSAVKALRKVKGREEKPFAIMFSDIKEIKEYCRVDNVEEKLLTSSSRPIILLEQVENNLKAMACGEFQKSRFIGAFLPSMGAQYMILEEVNGPLIVTSANISETPIIKEDDKMREFMRNNPEIEAMVYNDRDIRVSVDDSVARVIDGQPQIIRRSKGYVPLPLYCDDMVKTKNNEIKKEILALGGQLKNSFALSKEGFTYPSQFFGDMDSVENQELYRESLDHMKELLRIKPNRIVCDMHPDYFTSKFAETYRSKHKESTGEDIKIEKVQHHHAHIASVMAEHEIKGPVIGVAFDGTGYGVDGAIWGGEFLLCEGKGYKREAHLAYVDMIGGNSSMKEAWKAAVSHIKAADDEVSDASQVKLNISDIVDYAMRNDTLSGRDIKTAKKALDAGINTMKTSSVGRLFDAVSAMLGICDYNSHEGQCAMLLEDAAARAIEHPKRSERDDLALSFHERVAYMIAWQCTRIAAANDMWNEDRKVALSGGVFQNGILMEKTLEFLKAKDFKTYYNVSVSPNDGGIALGQAYIGAMEE